MATVVTPANVGDRAASRNCCARPNAQHRPSPTSGWNKGYTGTTVADAAAKAGVTVDIVSGPNPGHGFIVQPRRWVVERTNG